MPAKTYKQEIEELTTHPACRRIGEILDVLKARLDACCPAGPSVADPPNNPAAQPPHHE